MIQSNPTAQNINASGAQRPTLKKINGVYCRRLARGEIRQKGDRYTDEEPVVVYVGVPVSETADTFGLWRPLDIPGYRIRDLDEIVKVGDCAARIKSNGDYKVLEPAPKGAEAVGLTVREVVNHPATQIDCAFQRAVDFVVLEPIAATIQATIKPDASVALKPGQFVPGRSELTAAYEANAKLVQENLDLQSKNKELSAQLADFTQHDDIKIGDRVVVEFRGDSFRGEVRGFVRGRYHKGAVIRVDRSYRSTVFGVDRPAFIATANVRYVRKES